MTKGIQGIYNEFIYQLIVEQGPTRHRPMAPPVVFRNLSYSTTLAELAIIRLWRCPAFGRAGTCLFLSVQSKVTQSHIYRVAT